jgi:predicted ATPase
MITQLSVKNFRSLADVTIELGPLTVLVGQNGSGKSSVIDVFRFVSDALRLGMKTAITRRAGMNALRRWSAKGRPYDVEIGIRIQDSSFEGEYYFVLGSERKGEYRVKTELCSGRFANDLMGPPGKFHLHEGKWIIAPAETESSFPITFPTSFPSHQIQQDTLILPLLGNLLPYHTIYSSLTQMGFYTIFPKLLRDPQKPTNPYPLEEDASNLASALDHFPDNEKTKFKRAVQFVIPDIDDYQVRQSGSRLIIRLRHTITDVEDSNGKENRMPWFEMAQESDGTIRMFALLTALHQTPSLSMISLEEPELTVHPGAMAKLWEEVIDASRRGQILITTHSPDLLDLCTIDQLRVVEKIQGITYIGEVADPQKEIIREQLFTPGQLMQSQGLLRKI